MICLYLPGDMCLIEDRENLFAGLEARGVGDEDCAAHVGAGDKSGGLGTGGGVVIVLAHNDFCVSIVEGHGVDLD